MPHELGPRRPGDPTRLVASSERIECETGWVPLYSKLDEMVRTAAEWRIKHPDGYRSQPRSNAGTAIGLRTVSKRVLFVEDE